MRMKLKKEKWSCYGLKIYRFTCCIIGGCLSLLVCICPSVNAQQNSGRASAAPEQMTSDESTAYRAAFYKLIQEKDFFEAKSYFSQHRQGLGTRGELFSKAFLAGALHQPQLALDCASQLLDAPENLEDSLQLMLLDLQQRSAASLGQYAIAKDAAKEILEHYTDRLSPGVLKLQDNNYKLWSALVKEPAQTLDITQDVQLGTYRDTIGMWHIKFTGPANTAFDFNYDPAARISTANESTAEKLHMRFLPGTLSVASATGHLVSAKIAICDSLSIDAIQLRNVVFLVLPDADLTVPKMHYHMDAILGLPVLQAMHEIQLIHGKEFFVPKHASAKRRGLPLMMHQGQMIIGMDGNPYELHPGTDQSLLFQPYFEANQSMVKLQGRPINMEVGDPGASSVMEGYQYDLQLRIQGKAVILENTAVLPSAVPGSGHLYGRLGQDFMQSFDTLTINFDKMFVDLE